MDSRIDMTQLVWDPANPPTIAYTQAPTLPAGAKLPSMQMVTEADLYANSDRTVPLAPLVVQTQGTYTFNASVTGTTSGSVVVTAKTPGVLLAKQTLDPTGSSNPTSASLTFNANAGDQVFFEFQARDPNVAASISTYSVLPQGGGTNLPAALYSATPADILPQDYRGWTHFGYYGQGANASLPISITSNDLTLSNAQGLGSTSQQQAYQQTIVNDINNQIDPSSLAQQFHTNVITYIPVAALPQNTNPPPGMPGAVDHWQGPDNSLWVAAAEMSSSRQGGTKYVPAATADPYAGAAAVARISENDQTAIAGSAGISIPGTGLGVNGGLSYSTANGYSLLDFKDLNGDGFPDVVANGLSVQYSPMTGGLEATARTINVPGYPQDSGSQANSYGLGGDYAFSGANPLSRFGIGGGGGRSGTTTGDTGQQMTTLGITANITQGTILVNYDLIDINGDGLPDRVSISNNGSNTGTVTVQINLGYGFAAPEVWDAGTNNAINSGQSKANEIGGSIGYNDGIYGFGGGINTSEHKSWSVVTLQDVNGDGLADRVTNNGGAVTVAFNTGSGFGPDVPFPGMTGDIAHSRQETQGGGLYFTIAYPIVPTVPGVWFIFNPGADGDTHVGRTEATIADIDGDGFPDYLTSTADSTITASLNTRGRTNLLQQVTRPLGGFFAVNYTRTGNTLQPAAQPLGDVEPDRQRRRGRQRPGHRGHELRLDRTASTSGASGSSTASRNASRPISTRRTTTRPTASSRGPTTTPPTTEGAARPRRRFRDAAGNKYTDATYTYTVIDS